MIESRNAQYHNNTAIGYTSKRPNGGLVISSKVIIYLREYIRNYLSGKINQRWVAQSFSLSLYSSNHI